MAGDFNYAMLDEVAHRPWQMPSGPWVMTQTWHDLLFTHWRLPPDRLRPLVPAGFELDLHDGAAWIGIVPFLMTNVAPRGLPAMPGISEFPELNVRTYVRVGDRPGVYFFSLDAGSRLAVQTARRLLNLPYFSASMSIRPASSGVQYESRRIGDAGTAFEALYGGTGEPARAAPGSLDEFLTERYCLYHFSRRGRPYRLEIHHPPWPLQRAWASIGTNTMAAASGITLPLDPPILHFSKRLDMVAWRPATLAR
jgi:uncharacterized protein YqjF (DUF2071 family)